MQQSPSEFAVLDPDWPSCLTFDTSFIGSNGGTLDTNIVLLDGLGSLDGHLIVRLVHSKLFHVLHLLVSPKSPYLVTVGNAEVVVFDINVKVRQNKLVLDDLPDDSGHFVTVQVDDGVLYNNLLDGHISRFRRASKKWKRKGKPETMGSVLYSPAEATDVLTKQGFTNRLVLAAVPDRFSPRIFCPFRSTPTFSAILSRLNVYARSNFPINPHSYSILQWR